MESQFLRTTSYLSLALHIRLVLIMHSNKIVVRQCRTVKKSSTAFAVPAGPSTPPLYMTAVQGLIQCRSISMIMLDRKGINKVQIIVNNAEACYIYPLIIYLCIMLLYWDYMDYPSECLFHYQGLGVYE